MTESSWMHFHNYPIYHNSAFKDVKLSPSNIHLHEACQIIQPFRSDLLFHLRQCM